MKQQIACAPLASPGPRGPRTLYSEIAHHQLAHPPSDFEPADLPLEFSHSPREREIETSMARRIPCTPLASPGPGGPRTPSTELAHYQPPGPPSDFELSDSPLKFSHILHELSLVHNKVCEQRRLIEDRLKRANDELESMRLKSMETAGSFPSQQKLIENSGCDTKDNFDDSGGEFLQILSDSKPPVLTGKHFLVRGASMNDIADELALMKGWKSYDPRRKSDGSNFNERLSKLPSSMSRLVENWVFDTFVSIAIVSNSIVIGIAVDYAARHGLQLRNNPTSFKIIERVFTCVFACELALRLLAGVRCFFFGAKKWWNLFDFLVVILDIWQSVVESMDDGGGVDLSVLRVMRIVRVIRAIRVIRLVRFFKELRVIIYAILRCSTSLLWSLMLFLIIFYVFGIFVMIQVTDFIGSNGLSHPKTKDLREFFGDMPTAMLTLYMSMSGGISWKEVSDALVAVHWSNSVALSLFIFFTVFVVANILTGIFVDTAIVNAQNDREEVIHEQLQAQESEMTILKHMFYEADKDGSGQITLDEFQQHLGDVRVRAHLRVLGIQVNEALGLFKLLDQDDSGQIGIEEFVIGCVRLKGEAKGIDLATLMYETKKLVEHIVGLDRFCAEQFNHLKKSHESLWHHFRLPHVPEGTVC